MAYTTVQKVKNSLTLNYWKSIKAKLTQDGFAYNEGTGVFTDESDFIQQFIDNAASFIEDYVSSVIKGPFVANGVLDNINRWLAIYDCEQYILSGTSDRTISVTINEDKKRALQLLDKIVKGDIELTSTDDDANSTASPGLIEPDGDGDPLANTSIDENILFGTDVTIGTALEE